MKKELINIIEQGMLGVLNNEQLAKLHEILECSFSMYIEDCEEIQHSNDELLTLFLYAEGKELGDKIMSMMGTIPVAFANPLPSLHPLDLLVGLC